MCELVLNPVAAELVRKNTIDPTGVLTLRSEVFADGIVSSQEAATLLALDRSCKTKCDEWDHFYVEALGDYLVYQAEPRGHVSEENAEGLIRAVSMDGKVDTRTELRLLLHVMEKAVSVPSKLAAFALTQVKHAILNGEGAFAKDRTERRGVVCAEDVKMLKKVLYSGAGSNGLAISRDEANVLFDINDATSHADNSPEWEELFQKAVAASVLLVARASNPTASEARQREIWLDDTSVSVGGFFSSVLGESLNSFLGKVKADTSLEGVTKQREADESARVSAAAIVDSEEAQWLVGRISYDGKICTNERALIDFIAAESPRLADELKPLLKQSAA